MTTRIHIGNISPQLQSNPTTLTTRLEKYGEIITPISFHTKPLQDHYFAYITLNLTNSNFDKLKQQLNGVTFMGRKLSISLAKPSYMDVKLEDKYKSDRINRDRISQVRQLRIRDAHTSYRETTGGELCTAPLTSGSWSVSEHRLGNASGNTKNKPPSHRLNGTTSYGSWTTPKNSFNKSYSNISGRGDIIKGRHRITPRKDIRHQTIRLLINNELKLIKCYKTKLWGLEKKSLQELSWKYESGSWINGDGELIEKVEEGEVIVEDEHLRNKDLLKFVDFNKPVVLDEEEGSEDDLKKPVVAIEEDVGELVAPPEEVYYDENDEGNEIDFATINQENVPTVDFGVEQEELELMSEHRNVDVDAEVDADVDADANTNLATDTSTNLSTKVNNLDTLRSLFNPTSESTFKLEISDDDIEETPIDTTSQQQILEQIQLKQQQEIQAIKQSKFGLFWPHLESPFLSTQSQLNKIGNVNDKIELPGEEVTGKVATDKETKYETWFWNNRGEISRQCKRRRRDVLRILNKRKNN